MHEENRESIRCCPYPGTRPGGCSIHQQSRDQEGANATYYGTRWLCLSYTSVSVQNLCPCIRGHGVEKGRECVSVKYCPNHAAVGSENGRSLAAMQVWRALDQVALTMLVCVCFRSILHCDRYIHQNPEQLSPVSVMPATDDHEALLQLSVRKGQGQRSAWRSPWRWDL